MFARYATAVSTGTFMTFALLFVMQLLITIQPGALVEQRVRALVPWVLRDDPAPPPPPPAPIDREKLTDAPLPPARARTSGSGPSTGVPMPKQILPPQDRSLKPLDNVDGPLVNLIRISPTYPASAAKRGLEGYVVVQFDVTARGFVANAVVVESSDRVFESAAIKAAQRFRFKPVVINGVAQSSTGIQNLFRFEMDKE